MIIIFYVIDVRGTPVAVQPVRVGLTTLRSTHLSLQIGTYISSGTNV